MQPINVLSLFDGMSCGQIALERAGIPVNTYYASEIDKYAIKVTQANYPNTIQLGNIRHYYDWCLDGVDLILVGSPCQGFSLAGKQAGFKDERSKLFYSAVNILGLYRPTKFLFENVKMNKHNRDIISGHLHRQPILINSCDFSAQNRARYYWTNIPQDQEKRRIGINCLDPKLADIIEHGIVDRDKSYCIDANYWKGGNLKSYFEKCRRQLVFEPVNFTERRTAEAKKIRREHMIKYGKDWSPRRSKKLVARTDGKVNCLTTSLTKEHIILDETLTYRKLTPIECERLQTVPDNYTNHVSNTQRYKMLGNGWTVDVIVHILKNLISNQ